MSFSEFSNEDYSLIGKVWKELLESASRRCRSEQEIQTVIRAYEFSNEAHKNIRRHSGEPYIIHPMAVAKIVVDEIGLGYKSIAAALLHDVVEDTEYSVEDIENLFGSKIASLVDGLTKIKTVLDNENEKGSSFHTESLQAENFKRILLTLGDDVRVVLIKLADRLHNCRTIEYMPEHKMDKILSETMYLFIPLAHRLGLYGIKSEMENIWLKYKEPEEFRNISERIEKSVEIRKTAIEDFIAPIKSVLDREGLKYTILKRIKTPYSIWYKMHTKHVPFEQIYDLYAVRIIFDTPVASSPDAERKKAYDIYLALTDLYREQPGRTRDWIRHPKSNGYEALHCTLMSRSGVWVEVQIRSKRMNDIAEKGIAAHWMYKQNGYISENGSEMDKWLAAIQEILTSNDVNDMELLDIIHRDLVSTEIVVFTPKGEQRSIPNGSTALDFAYNIHSEIGNSAIAAKVNMKLAPLSQQLKSGDQVQIITSARSQPKMEWLQFLQTRHAKSNVVDYFRKNRDDIAEKGKVIFDERLKAMGMTVDNDMVKRFCDYCQVADRTELFFRIGIGIVGPEEFRTIVNDKNMHGKALAGYYLQSVSGDNHNYIMAECCNPLPGDPLIGFISADGTVTVHKKSCTIAENLATKYGDRVVIPQWQLLEKEYPIRISIKGIDRMGLLNEITQFISHTMKANMRKLQLGCEDGVFEGYIELLVKDKKSLDNMIDGLCRINGVQDVVRTDI